MSEMNYEMALARVGGDKELLAELVGLFIEEYPVLLDAVRKSLVHRDGKGVNGAAHQLKGLLAQFGADAARIRAYEVELAGKEGDLARAASSLRELDALMKLLHPELVQVASGQ